MYVHFSLIMGSDEFEKNGKSIHMSCKLALTCRGVLFVFVEVPECSCDTRACMQADACKCVIYW